LLNNGKVKEMSNMKERVLKALESIRPGLQADGGDVELVRIDEDGKVVLKLTGACGGCPMSEITLQQGIERILKMQVPEVTSVQAIEEQ
jgi:Fe-S cluster biogenesis protein NfuA